MPTCSGWDRNLDSTIEVLRVEPYDFFPLPVSAMLPGVLDGGAADTELSVSEGAIEQQ
jgi:hypothetical protein